MRCWSDVGVIWENYLPELLHPLYMLAGYYQNRIREHCRWDGANISPTINEPK